MSDIDFMNTGTLATLGFGGVFILIGVFLAYMGIKSVATDLESRNWPTVEAVYVKSEVVKHVRRDDDNRSHTYTSYTCDRTYRYEVGEQSYDKVDQIRAEGREEAVALSKDVKVGEKVTLFYSLDEPSLARSELLSPWRNWVWFLGAILFPLFGVGVMYLGLFHAGE